MASTPLLIISSKGLAVASRATPTGPFINIKGFAIGSAYGYEVTKEQESLSGDMLYEGAVSSYSYIGNNIINLVCKLPPDAGPFDFGEVALYLEDGTMFAKATFDKPQSKYSSLGTNLSLTYSFNCLLQLEQSVAVFQIVSAEGSQQSVLQVAAWTEVVPPEMAANPDIPLVVVQELDGNGNGTLLVQSSNTKWTPAGTFYLLGNFVIGNASSTWLDFPIEQWPYTEAYLSPYPVESKSFVVETAEGYFRSVASIQHIGTPVNTVRLLLNPDPLPSIPGSGSTVGIHINDPAIGTAFSLWSNLRQIIANAVQPLSATVSVANLTASINGGGEAAASVTALAEGNAPYVYYWSNVSGLATFDDPTKATVSVRAQLANGGIAQGVVQCEIRDSFGLRTTVQVPWAYSSELAWVVPTQAMFPGSTSFIYDSITRKSTVTYATAGTFSFVPPNTTVGASDLIGAGGGGGGGAAVPSGNSNYAWGGAGGGGGAGGHRALANIELLAGVPKTIVVGKGGTGGLSVAAGLANTGVTGESTQAFNTSVPGGLGGQGAYSFCCGTDPGYSEGGLGIDPSGGTGGRGSRGGSGPAGGIHVDGTAATGNNAGAKGVDSAGGYCGGGGGGGGDAGQLGGAGADSGAGISGYAGRKGGGGGGSSGGWTGGAAGGKGGDGEVKIVF